MATAETERQDAPVEVEEQKPVLPTTASSDADVVSDVYATLSSHAELKLTSHLLCP